MSEPRKSTIFISYSRQDSVYVDELINAFEAQGLSVWLDNQIDYGTAWQREIEKHLEACRAFVLVMTPQSNESHWVKCELSFALELKKPIFPLLLEGRRWFSVAAIQTVDVTDRSLPPRRFFDAVSRSVAGMKRPAEIKSSNTASTVSIQDKVNADFVEDAVEIELAVLREEVAGVQVQQTDKINATDARYTNLKRHLKNREWRNADDETYRLMATELGKSAGQWLTLEDIENFPCKPLKTLDELWVKHSDSQFGFSIQKEIYLHCEGAPDGRYDIKAFNKLCEANGWKVKGKWVNVKFNDSSPVGHLPAIWWVVESNHLLWIALISRLEICAHHSSSSCRSDR